MSSGGAPQPSAAFIDLATYGELESYLYSSEPSPYMQIKHKKIIGAIMVVIILYYLKKK
jgi:hypothetical protein